MARVVDLEQTSKRGCYGWVEWSEVSGVAQGFTSWCLICPRGMRVLSAIHGMDMVAPWEQGRGGMGLGVTPCG